MELQQALPFQPKKCASASACMALYSLLQLGFAQSAMLAFSVAHACAMQQSCHMLTTLRARMLRHNLHLVSLCVFSVCLDDTSLPDLYRF